MRPTFCDWLAAKVGTTKWAVFPRMTDRLRRKGCDLAIPQKRFTALMAEYEALHGPMYPPRP